MIAIGYALLMAIIIFIDQLTKIWAQQVCFIPIPVTSFLSCSLIYNRGVAWSLGESDDIFFSHLLVSFVFLLTLLLVLYAYNRWQKGRMIWAECAIIAGSLSNLYDRYTVSGVIDFIEFSYGFFNFPVFNIADSAIVLGVMMMILQEYREKV